MKKWDAELYDTKHAFVTNYGESLIDWLQPKADETILDIGCGTGALTATIAKSGARTVGIDASADMIEKASRSFPNVTFSVENASNLPYTEQFDAIFSNAALHWMKDSNAVIASMYKSLKPNGRVVAEFGGHQNVASIVKAIKDATIQLGYEYIEEQFPWYFPSAEEYAQKLKNEGFQVVAMQHYERATPLVGEDGMHNWLKMFSDLFFTHLQDEQKNAILQKVETILRPTNYVNGEWIADYWRLRFVAVK